MTLSGPVMSYSEGEIVSELSILAYLGSDEFETEHEYSPGKKHIFYIQITIILQLLTPCVLHGYLEKRILLITYVFICFLTCLLITKHVDSNFIFIYKKTW